ncbi:Metallo-dependent hydrolase [Neurospora crassa]|uniref:adenosine deaminase n=2 Tax=Neurospora crassa TaxID=5141 RepID=V5IL15_NEUCR|nr:adenosine deaminase, variant [Neurospora crassa OR74A]XP_011394672.1 adenosine deaminase [Neurospora crassa OR74A]KHE83433.1 Metallo-dependent hydrolase [Neurospora crassa]ESA42397.1 adenosine deaminase [Neurospora crassa OR74A]ESA42398.1 adenosine deaminase, variant [Neurospora crassa OR74A]CAD37012.1 related to cecr1 protein [Neurospora crassa]|eukprot:XP_011394671.1 adenosine deaminase, variant [Neurospora crassa OR74A]
MTNQITDEEWADILAHELPTQNDPILQKYHAARAALIAEEQKQRSDHVFRQSLSPLARRACSIVSRIRLEEQKAIWTPDLEEQLARKEENNGIIIHPGMMFTLAKETMEATKLWRIVRKMPKGALLHSHCDAMVDFDFLLGVVLETEGMGIATPERGGLGTEERRREAEVVVKFVGELERKVDAKSIWAGDEEGGGGGYEPGTFINLVEAADAFPDGGRKGFLQWLKSRCILSQTDAIEQRHGSAEIWRKFIRCFGVIGSMLHYEPIWRRFLRRLLQQLVEDGVYWVEVRFAWQLDYCREGCTTPEPDYTAMFNVIEEEVAAFKATPEGSSFWGLRMIWTTVRAFGPRTIIQSMNDCIATKINFPHLIAGYDLVGPEDAGRHLTDLLPELFWFRKQCAAEGVEIPFFLHAGETLGDGDAVDHNLFDALLLGARRIGHGFSLYKHPQLIKAVKDKRVLIESCPISNEVLRLTGSIMQHPLPALLARGVPCALCNDDPAILGQDMAGMTHDFWQALQGWENLGLAGLGSLAENSVRWAAFEDQTADEWARDVREASMGSGTKAERLKQWAVEWEKFCVWVVDEYGDEYGGDEA